MPHSSCSQPQLNLRLLFTLPASTPHSSTPSEANRKFSLQARDAERERVHREREEERKNREREREKAHRDKERDDEREKSSSKDAAEPARGLKEARLLTESRPRCTLLCEKVFCSCCRVITMFDFLAMYLIRYILSHKYGWVV